MALALSAEQEDALNRIVVPSGWTAQNPPMTAAPLPFFNSYSSPAWGIRTSSPITDQPEKSNQFNSSLTQPKGASTIWDYRANGKQGGGCACSQSGGFMVPEQMVNLIGVTKPMMPHKTRIFKTQPKVQVGGKKILHM